MVSDNRDLGWTSEHELARSLTKLAKENLWRAEDWQRGELPGSASGGGAEAGSELAGSQHAISDVESSAAVPELKRAPPGPRGLARLQDVEHHRGRVQTSLAPEQEGGPAPKGKKKADAASRRRKPASTGAGRNAALEGSAATPIKPVHAHFKLRDSVIALPNEDLTLHREFAKTLRAYLPSSLNLYDQVVANDLTYAHRQVQRLMAWEHAAIAGAVKEKFFATIEQQGRKLDDKAKLWRDGQPTSKGLRQLAETGTNFDEIFGEVYSQRISQISQMNQLGAHHRSVRRDAALVLERAIAEANASQGPDTPILQLPPASEVKE